MSKQSFTIVFVPADPAASIEEQVLSASTVDEQVSMVTSHAKAHFTRVKDMDSLSAAQKDANQQRMLDSVRKNNPTAQISEAQLSMLATMNLVDTVPLIVNKPATKHIGVNLYVDDQGEAKQLPVNPRASAICAGIGRSLQVRGDAFISRFFDNDDRFERLDFFRSELADAQTQFFVSARENAMASSEPQSQSSGTSGTLLRRCGQGFMACEQQGTLRCARCKDIWYCSAACQKLDWTRHKSACSKK